MYKVFDLRSSSSEGRYWLVFAFRSESSGKAFVGFVGEKQGQKDVPESTQDAIEITSDARESGIVNILTDMNATVNAIFQGKTAKTNAALLRLDVDQYSSAIECLQEYKQTCRRNKSTDESCINFIKRLGSIIRLNFPDTRWSTSVTYMNDLCYYFGQTLKALDIGNTLSDHGVFRALNVDYDRDSQGASSSVSTNSQSSSIVDEGFFARAGMKEPMAFSREGEGEGAAADTNATHHLHFPGGNSGVTIGIGFDLGTKEKEEIRDRLTRVQVPQRIIDVLVQAERILGEEGVLKFIREHTTRPDGDKRKLPDGNHNHLLVRSSNGSDQLEELSQMLTEKQIQDLFVNEYQEHVDRMSRLCQNWDSRHPVIRAILVDLDFRGDYGHKSSVKAFQDAVKSNDLIALKNFLADETVWHPWSEGDPKPAAHSAWIDKHRFDLRKNYCQKAIDYLNAEKEKSKPYKINTKSL